ncbi:MAG: hypothetical protein Q8L09_05215 [Candidatus Moranbacteria bacterium]|nr:hypothetical protein [Candidatus Moranbacteria bacterium]
MARRTKKIKNSLSKSETVRPAGKGKTFSGFRAKPQGTKGSAKERKNFRFSVSLILLTAALEMSLLILLMSLINAQAARGGDESFAVSAVKSTKKLVKPANQKIDDQNLDFELTVPAQLGEWSYKTGYIKSPIDDGISDQYLQIYLPDSGKMKSRNFDEMMKVVLTIKKFSTDEWKKLEKGCQNENSLFCEAAGTKIAEKNESVYAYDKISNCPSVMENKCDLVDKIIDSFQLK